MNNDFIQEFLNELKNQGKVAPAGALWHDFYLFLDKYKAAGEAGPPLPLILAASGESPSSKHLRLLRQLDWAMNRGILEQAIEYLLQLDEQKWEISSEANWYSDHYWTPG